MPDRGRSALLWPMLTVEDVDATLAFYRDQLGFEQDLCLKDARGTFLGSVEVGDGYYLVFVKPVAR